MVRTKCGLTQAHFTFFFRTLFFFFPQFCRFGAVRPEPVPFRSPTKKGSPTPAEVARNRNHHLQFTLNLRSKAFPSSGEACLLLGVPPRPRAKAQELQRFGKSCSDSVPPHRHLPASLILRCALRPSVTGDRWSLTMRIGTVYVDQ